MNYRKKALLTMTALLCLNAGIFAQSVSLNLGNVSVKEAMNQVKDTSGYSFVYSKGDIDTGKKVSVKAQQLDEAIRQILDGQNVTYEIKGKNIIIKRITAGRQKGNSRKVSGVVKDSQGAPIIGANVSVKGTSMGTITDINGNYELDIPNGSTISISYIGFLTQEIASHDKSVLDIVLKEDAKSLDEVVVVGYGTMKKSDLTGAITQVKAKDLPQTGNMSLGQMLTGKAAGMQVSLQSAQPGGGVWMQIRGNASGGAGNSGPLYVIDGFPITSDNVEPGSGNQYSSGNKSALNNLNPADIESIEILKDASATSIYGARAANGVVLITTKRGKEGEKPKIQYSGSVSFQKRVKQIDMLDAQGFMTETNRVLYEDWLSDNRIAPYGTTDPSTVAPYSPKYTDEQIANAQTTDWLGAVERTGIITQHNLSLTGGTDKSSYYISGNYYNHQGVIKAPVRDNRVFSTI